MFLAPSRAAVYSRMMVPVVFLLSGCDVSINGKDIAPVVVILSPGNNDQFTTADQIEFTAEVVDDDLAGVLASWTIGIESYDATLNVTGQAGMLLNLPVAGDYNVRFNAVDAGGAQATTDIDITIVEADGDADGVPDTEDCAPENPDYSSVQSWFYDADLDNYGDPAQFSEGCEPPESYVLDNTDCNDAEPAIYPGAPEYCDGVDNNCDTIIDENTAVDVDPWYEDADGDDYGKAGVAPVYSCNALPGYGPYEGDCNDQDPAFHPYAEEVCTDTVDYNCNGKVGDQQLYEDVDGDGRGNGNKVVTTDGDPCAPVPGASRYPDDCDDGDLCGDAACVATAATVYPGAIEQCDGIDNNCDSVVDERDTARGPQAWADADGDSFGGTVSTIDCPPHSYGYVTINGDCNDADAAINPNATEVCDANNTDEDCDSLADDADSSVDFSTTSLWYSDLDADSYGAGSSTSACDAPTGMVADTTDCDDSRADVNPAAAEVCDPSNIDEDCDSVADDDDMSATGQTFWYQDNDADGYGSSIMQEVCDEPAGYSSVTNDCNDANGNVSPAVTTDTCDSVDSDCDGLEDQDAAQDGYESSAKGNNGEPATASELLDGGTTVTVSGLNLINQETEDWYRAYFAADDSTNIKGSFRISSLPTGCTAELYLWDESQETSAACQPGAWTAGQGCLSTSKATLTQSGLMSWTGSNTQGEDTFLIRISCPSYHSGQCNSLYSITATRTY